MTNIKYVKVGSTKGVSKPFLVGVPVKKPIKKSKVKQPKIIMTW